MTLYTYMSENTHDPKPITIALEHVVKVIDNTIGGIPEAHVALSSGGSVLIHGDKIKPFMEALFEFHNQKYEA